MKRPNGWAHHALRWMGGGAALLLTSAILAEPLPLVRDKVQQSMAIERNTFSRSDFGAYRSPQPRARTPRDSGHKEALIFIRNVNFRLFGNIGFLAERAVVAARPNTPQHPVVIDNPKSFSLAVLNGRVVISPLVLKELLNTHVFNFNGAPLRKIEVVTKTGQLVLSGEMNRRGQWVPFSMEGGISVPNPETLVFTPTIVLIDGQSAAGLLKAANVDLDELLTIKATGVTLIKSAVHLKPNALFPPPALSLSVKTATLEPRGLVLEAVTLAAPTAPEPLDARASYLLIKGGDVKFLNIMPVDILMQISALDAHSRLDFSLYDYRAQVAGGFFRFRQDGATLAYIKNYSELRPGDTF